MKRTIIVLSGLFLIALIIIFVKGRFGVKENTLIKPAPNLTTHPIYSTYKFPEKETTINIGDQPLYLPTSLITEAMKRDLLLKDELSKLNTKLQFYSFLKGDDVNFFIRSGDLQAGIGGDMPALTAAVSTEIIIPALIQQGYCSIVATKPMLINELKGKRIAYAFGSNAHYALLKVLKAGKLSQTQVNLIEMEVTEMPESLASGKIDAYSAWEPTPTISLMNYPESVVINRNLSSGYIYFKKTFVEEHPEAVRQIIAAQIRALRWMQKDRQNLLLASKWSLQRINQFTDLNINLTEKQIAALSADDILRRCKTPFIPKNYLKEKGPIHSEFRFLKKVKKIADSSKWEKVRDSFDNQLISKVVSNSKRYKLNKFLFDFNGEKND